MTALNYPAKPWTDGDIFTDNDIEYVYVDDGVNPGYWTAEVGGSTGYVLPIATSTVLGGIKVGSRLTITGDGTLSADVQGGGTVGSLQEVTDVGNTTTNGATFGGLVTVGDSAFLTGASSTGNLNIRNDGSASSAVYEVYNGGFNPDDRRAVINADGSAEFAGLVGTQGVYAGDIAAGPYAYLATAGSVDLWPAGTYILTGRNSGGTVTSRISGDGGATFAEGRVVINSATNGDIGQEYFRVTDASNWNIAIANDRAEDGTVLTRGVLGTQTSQAGTVSWGIGINGTTAGHDSRATAAVYNDKITIGTDPFDSPNTTLNADGSGTFGGNIVCTSQVQVNRDNYANVELSPGYLVGYNNAIYGRWNAGGDLYIGGNDDSALTELLADGSATFGGNVFVTGLTAFAAGATSLAESYSKAAFRVTPSSNSSNCINIGPEGTGSNMYLQGSNNPGNAARDIYAQRFGGSIFLGDSKIELKSDGSADFATSVQVGTTGADTTNPGGFVYSTRWIDNDNRGSAALNGASNDGDLASLLVIDRSGGPGVETVIIKPNGTASFGTIDTSNNTTASGQKLFTDGLIRVQRPGDGSSQSCFQSWTGNKMGFQAESDGTTYIGNTSASGANTSSSRITLNADGSAEFAGDVTLFSEKIDTALVAGDVLGALKFSSASNTDFCSISGHRNSGTAGSGRISFNLTGGEKARFDESGNLLIGGTLDADPTNNSPNISLNADGSAKFNTNDDPVLDLYRATTSIGGGVFRLYSDVGDTKRRSFAITADGTTSIGGVDNSGSPTIKLKADGGADFLSGFASFQSTGNLRIQNQTGADDANAGFFLRNEANDTTTVKLNFNGTAEFLGGTTRINTVGSLLVGTTSDNVADANIALDAAAGTGTFAGGVTVDGNRPLMIGTGAAEIDVKDKLNKMTSALEGLRDAASTSETLTDLKIAIVTALSQFQ